MAMGWAYGKVGNGNETETGNGNWKRKLETEMGTKDYQSLVQNFLHSVLSHYSSILFSIHYGTDFESCFAFTPVLCFVITAFGVID